MPGLRSLVARRRSSLASTPPCSPHSRNNTPSPSPSFPPSDHASVNASLSQSQDETENHCLMPGSGSDSTGGDEGLQKEEVRHRQEAGLRGEAYQTQEKGQLQEGEPGQGVQQDATSKAENFTQETTLINGGEGAVELGDVMSIETEPAEENRSILKVWSEAVSGVHDSTFEGIQASSCDRGSALQTVEIVSSHELSDEKKDTKSVVEDNIVQNVHEKSTGTIDVFSNVEGEIAHETNSETALSVNTNKDGTQQIDNDNKVFHKNESTSQLKEISLTDKVKESSDGNISVTAHVWKSESSAPNISEEGANQDSWSSDFLDVVESRRLSSACGESVNEGGTVEFQRNTGSVSECEENADGKGSLRNTEVYVDTSTHHQSEVIVGFRESNDNQVPRKNEENDREFIQDKTDGNMEVDERFRQGMERGAQYKNVERSKEPEIDQYPQWTESKDCEGGEKIKECEDCKETPKCKWGAGDEIRKASENSGVLEGATSSTYCVNEKENITENSQEENKDCLQLKNSEIREEMEYEDLAGAQNYFDGRQTDEFTKDENEYSDGKGLLNYETWRANEQGEAGKKNIVYEGREEFLDYKNREEISNYYQETFHEYGSEEALGEYVKETRIHEVEGDEISDISSQNVRQSVTDVQCSEGNQEDKLCQDGSQTGLNENTEFVGGEENKYESNRLRVQDEENYPGEESGIFEQMEQNIKSSMTGESDSKSELREDCFASHTLGSEITETGEETSPLKSNNHQELSSPSTYEYLKQDQGEDAVLCSKGESKDGNEPRQFDSGSLNKDCDDKKLDGSTGISGQLTGDTANYDVLLDLKDSISEEEESALDRFTGEDDTSDKQNLGVLAAEGDEEQSKVSGEGSELFEAKVDIKNEGESKDDEIVIEDREVSPSSKKNESLKDDGITGVNNKRPYPFTVSPKVKKGPGRCSELSATEIESTLASRGVTIVRRMVDSKENSSNRGNNEASQNPKKDVAGKSGVVVTPHLRNTRQSARLLSLYKTHGRPNLKEYGPPTNPSNSLRPIGGPGSSGVTKDLYKSINARGTLIHPGSKTPQTISGAKGIQFNTRGVSIQFNPKGVSSLNLSSGGTTIYSKTRGPNIYTNTKGTSMQMNPKGVTVQTAPRMFSTNTRSRGPVLHSLRGTNLQANPRALATMGNQRGMVRPMRYSSPRGLRPSLAGMNVQPKSAIANPRMRGMNPQSFKVGANQMQSNTSGYAIQSKSSMGLPASKSGAVSLHSTISSISTQSRSVKVCPHSQSTGMTSQFKPGELLSQTKSGTGNMPLQTNIAGMSPQQQRSDGMLSPPNRSAEMSPQSRPGQMPSHSVGSGIYAQAKFTGLSPDSNMGPTQQSMMMDQSKSGVASSPGGSIVHQPRSGLAAGHMSVSSSSQHLAHLSMMDYSSQSGTALGLPPHSSASNRLLPPHSVPGMMPQGNNSLASQLALSSGLSSLATSESFASATSEGFPALSHSEFLGRSTTETFSPYNTLSGFPPHSSTTTDFSSNLNTGDFSMQASTGAFPAQTNLVGFSPQTNPCVYPPHVSSGGFTSHNSGTVIGHSGTDSFAAHPSCGSFTPTPVNASGYPPHSTAQLYNTPTNASDILGYPSSRDFMMNPGSREFSPYSGSNQLTNQLPQDMPSGSRDFALQNPNTGISVPTNAGTIVGDQYSQAGYGDPLAHSSFQQDPLQTRSNPSEVPLLPDLRDSVPVYGNYRDPVAQETLRTSQMQGSYRDMPLSSVQSHTDTRAQNLQANYKDQPVSSAYRDQDIIANYLESSVLNYRDPGDIGSCPEQTNPAYRPTSSHTSPSEQQVLPGFNNPASHASPQEQVLSNYSESASPRDQVLSQQPCRDNTGQMGSGESVLSGFRDSMNSNNSAHQDLSGFRDSMTYPGCRETGNYNMGYEKPGSNTSDYASSTSSRHSDVTQGGRSNTYKDPHSVPGYRLTDPSSNMKDISTCSDSAVLPSFTESFDSASPNDMNRKDGSSTLSHYKPMSEYGSLKGSPASVSTESTCATSPFVNHHTGEMSPLANEYPHSYGREPSNYPSKRMYVAQPHDSFSPAQYSDEGGGGHLTNVASNNFPGIKDQFFPEASNVHITVTDSIYSGPKNSIAKSDMTGLSQPVVSDSQLSSGINNIQGPSGTKTIMSIPGKSDMLDEKELSRDASSNNLYHGDKGPLNDTHTSPLGFHNRIRKASGTQTGTQAADEVTEGINYQPFLGSDCLSPNCPIEATNKFPSVSSPTKSDSNSSPSTQERIVIKMKLLHANSAVGNDGELAEDASVKDTGTNNKNSVKYSMAKYTRWTIDSIINGSEEGSDGAGKEEDSRIIHGERDENSEKYPVVRKGSRQRSSESCGDVKDTGLDTNKNLMKKSIKITITNPLRARISSSDEDSEVGKGKEKKNESKVVEGQKQQDGDIQVVGEVAGNGSKEEGVSLDPVHLNKKNTKNRRAKSPSPSPSLESCSSSSSVSRATCDSRRDSRSSDSSASSLHSEQGDPQGQGDLKKCSIVIKRIYTENNYSCYSSSLCEANDNVSLEDEEEEEEDTSKRRPKRKAAVEASERCHKTLRPLDYNTPKAAKVPILEKGKENTENSPPDKILIENSSPEKALTENIPQCSVLLYDVFMDSRLNKLSCPGCSRHYDSTDSIQVNISKATISLLCSGCRWLVVKDVRPHEIISSLAPS